MIGKGQLASQMTENNKTYGLLCGNGELPSKLIETLYTQNISFHCIGFEGLTEPFSSPSSQSWHKIGYLGEIFQTLKDHHVTHIVMAGNLKRPSLTNLSLDATGAKWLARLGISAFRGDDALLKKLIELMEEEGFIIVSPHDVLPDLIPTSGNLTKLAPSKEALQDAERGKEILNALSEFDVGQAIVVQQGLVLGIEAIEGTAELLKRVAHLKREGFGGVLVKIAKRGQSLKADVPTIGIETVKQAHAAGLAGIVISAKTTQILCKESVIEYCHKHNLFLTAIE